MPPRSERHRLHDILDAISRIDTYTEGNLRRAIDEAPLRDAVLYNLAIIGEATKNLSTDMRQRADGIDWAAVAGMRDAVIHEYFRVDVPTIKALDRHLTALKAAVERLLRELEA